MSTEATEVKIARLEEKIDGMKEALDKISTSLENLRTSFPTRSEFDIVRIAVLGAANDGGLNKRVDDLEKTAERRKGSWSTLQLIWTVGIGIGSALIAYWAGRH